MIEREELEHELDSKNHTIRMLQKQLVRTQKKNCQSNCSSTDCYFYLLLGSHDKLFKVNLRSNYPAFSFSEIVWIFTSFSIVRQPSQAFLLWFTLSLLVLMCPVDFFGFLPISDNFGRLKKQLDRPLHIILSFVSSGSPRQSGRDSILQETSQVTHRSDTTTATEDHRT